MMKEVYRASSYSPDKIAATYIRKMPGGQYRVFECDGQFGFTLRKYDTEGEELPEEVRNACENGATIKLDRGITE